MPTCTQLMELPTKGDLYSMGADGSLVTRTLTARFRRRPSSTYGGTGDWIRPEQLPTDNQPLMFARNVCRLRGG